MTSQRSDPATLLILRAGEENPRCACCDRLLDEWSKGDALVCEECEEQPEGNNP